MRRKLSQMERVIWSLSTRFQSIGVIAAKVRGEISAGEIRAALARIGDRYPLLRARVDPTSRWEAHFLSEGVSELPVRVIAADTEDAWVAVVEEELTRPFCFDRGPLARFALVRSAQYCVLLISANHIVLDGFSVIYLIRDILQMLGDRTAVLAPPPEVPAMEDLLPPSRTAAVPRTRTPKRLPASGPPPSAAAGRISVLAWSLPPAETATLCARSRAEQTTVYAALCAAFLRAFAELDPSSAVRTVETPANIRKRLARPVGEVAGNYVSLVQTAVDCAAEYGLWQIARTFKAQLTEQLQLDDFPARWRQVGKFASWMPNPVLSWAVGLMSGILLNVTYDVSISNLGRIPIPTAYGPLQLESIHAPSLSLGAPSHRIVGMLTFRDRIELSLTTYDRTLAQELKQRAMRHLLGAL